MGEESDIVLVVRCRECRHWCSLTANTGMGKCQRLSNTLIDEKFRRVRDSRVPLVLGHFTTPANWYCPLGEKPDVPEVEPIPALEEPLPAIA